MSLFSAPASLHRPATAPGPRAVAVTDTTVASATAPTAATILALVAALAAAPALAQSAAPAAPWSAGPPPVPPTPAGEPPARGDQRALLDDSAKAARDQRRALGSTLSERWELEPSTRQGRFLLRPYKPMYVLLANWTDNPNQQPTSPGTGNSVPEPLGLDALEAKFQISLKSKLWETIGGSNVDLWAAYTQVSYWQVYNTDLSRPFRETNYEPELFAIWGVNVPMLGGSLRFLGLGLNHQSNGRSEPLSRSWNRVIGQFGWESGRWSVLVRPWWRIQEEADVDDNPGIEDYIGRGELVITRRAGGHVVSVQLRHSLKGGDSSRGSVQLDWAIPVSSFLKMHFQVFSGYGAALIDYNHRQTTVGLGVSLVEWQ
jgi:phospholipase A1